MGTEGSFHLGISCFSESDVSQEFQPLVEALETSLNSGCPVVLEVFGSYLSGAGYLPHYLHLHCPGLPCALPLHPSYAVVPFSPPDRYLVEHTLHRVGDIYQRRKEAKWLRYLENRGLYNDFAMEDWVARFPRWRVRVENLMLPSHAFLPVDTVDPAGEVQFGHRPVLGRWAERGGLRPSVLVPTRRELGAVAALRLGQAELLIVNVQQTRGKQSLATAKAVLKHRRSGSATLVVVDGPEQYLEFDTPNILPIHRVHVHGDDHWVPKVTLSSVGLDRPQNEAMFEGASDGLADLSVAAGDLLRQARYLWWYLRQRLQVKTDDPTVQRWAAQVDELTAKGLPEAGYFTALRRLMETQATQYDVPLERKAAVEAAICSATGGTIASLVRYEADRAALIESLGTTLAATESDLSALGVEVWTLSSCSARPPDDLIVAGYYGMRTLQVIRRLRPRHLHFVADPSEVAWLVHDLERICSHLQAIGAQASLVGYKRIAETAERFLRPWSADSTEGIRLALSRGFQPQETESSAIRPSVKPGEVAVEFSDGQVWIVPDSFRVEIITPGRHGRFEVRRAKDLAPGDEVVAINSANQATFSQQLMTVLDSTVLKGEARLRQNWLGLVQAFRPASLRSLHATLVSRGISVSYPTVCSWIPTSPEDVGTAIPRTVAVFLEVACALGIGLPAEVLKEIFRAVRRIRAVHRRAGRALVRAIRSAYLGRLSPADMRYVETEWGMGLRELVNGAHLLIVDRVFTGREH